MSKPTINTAEIGKRIGHSPILATFIIDILGVPPSGKDRRAMLWTEEEFQLICSRLADRARDVADQYRK